jgi:hypothetical protein
MKKGFYSVDSYVRHSIHLGKGLNKLECPWQENVLRAWMGPVHVGALGTRPVGTLCHTGIVFGLSRSIIASYLRFLNRIPPPRRYKNIERYRNNK